MKASWQRIASIPLMILLLLGLPFASAQAQSAETEQEAPAVETQAVVLIYHRFGEDEYPSTSVTMDQFQSHIAELTSGRYTVLPLGQVVSALEAGETLPDRTVALTVDDAYLSFYEHAWPLLRDAGIPSSLFVATEAVDRGTPGYMTWDQIREVAQSGVTIGSQAVTHPHMPEYGPERWQRELAESADRIAEELGARPDLFAYPYGEASLEIMEATQAAGYRAAFGQHSGALNETNHRFYLPRYPINVNYGGIDRFRRLVNSAPLRIEGLSPRDPTLPTEGEGNPPTFGFTVRDDLARIDDLACYHSDTSQISQFLVMGARVEVRFDGAFAPGRTRINCTMPGTDGRWHWFGMQYYVPTP